MSPPKVRAGVMVRQVDSNTRHPILKWKSFLGKRSWDKKLQDADFDVNIPKTQNETGINFLAVGNGNALLRREMRLFLQISISLKSTKQ